jgi:hypothetical protein
MVRSSYRSSKRNSTTSSAFRRTHVPHNMVAFGGRRPQIPLQPPPAQLHGPRRKLLSAEPNKCAGNSEVVPKKPVTHHPAFFRSRAVFAALPRSSAISTGPMENSPALALAVSTRK